MCNAFSHFLLKSESVFAVDPLAVGEIRKGDRSAGGHGLLAEHTDGHPCGHVVHINGHVFTGFQCPEEIVKFQSINAVVALCTGVIPRSMA